MKKLFIITFMFITLSVSAQTVFFCFQPNDLGIGIRYDQDFKKTGLYASATHGRYKFIGGYIKEHTKIAFGAKVFNNQLKGSHNYFTVGLSNSFYSGIKESSHFNPNTMHPFALEVGGGTTIEWFAVSFRYELFKNNASIDIGFKF